MGKRTLRQLAGAAVMRRIATLRHELRYGPSGVIEQWKSQRETKARRRQLLDWFDELRTAPPDVLLGANISRSNGIRFHLEGIRRHSTMNVAFAPPDALLGRLSYHDLHTTFIDDVMSFDAAGIRVIHSHVYPYYIRWCRSLRESGRLWVHTYHLPYFALPAEMPPWQREINDTLDQVARHAHVRISVSKWQQQYLLDTRQIDTIYIPNGVDAAECDLADPNRFRERCAADSFVLFVGRNESVKNPRAFIELAAMVPDIAFVAIGEGMTPEHLEKTLGLPLPANLIALGQLSRENVQDALAACSALVVTSLREGLPTLVLEALLRKKPIVVPDDPGCVEAVCGGKFGLVFEPGNLVDLRSKLMAALASVDSDRADARDWVLREYDWKVVAGRLDAVYAAGT